MLLFLLKIFQPCSNMPMILSGELLSSTEFQSHFHMSVSRHFSCSFLTFLNSTGACDSKPTALKHGIFLGISGGTLLVILTQ